jgi:alkane 1-monooxygenase
MNPELIGKTVPDGSTEVWKDKKSYLWLLGLMVPGLGIAFALGFIASGGWWGFALVGPLLINVIIPVFDLVFGRDASNPPDEIIEALENDKYYRWIVFMYVPLMYVVLFAGFDLLMGNNPVHRVLDWVGAGSWADAHLGALYDNAHFDMAWWVSALWALSLAGVVGIGINTAHELGHKKESVERWLSKITLAPTFYGHFYIEHNRGHHVRVATPEDPASS